MAQGLIITERNYLEVYPYDRWSDKEIPEYSVGETFDPASIDLNEGETTAPPLLSEADLIALMVSGERSYSIVFETRYFTTIAFCRILY